jgi:hypothetical protein
MAFYGYDIEADDDGNATATPLLRIQEVILFGSLCGNTIHRMEAIGHSL